MFAINPAALIAAPLIASTFNLPPVSCIDPAELWAAGVDLTADELSALLEECTFHTIESTTDADGMPAFYLVDPSGDRDPDPFEDLADLADFVGWRIDEALADCAP